MVSKWFWGVFVLCLSVGSYAKPHVVSLSPEFLALLKSHRQRVSKTIRVKSPTRVEAYGVFKNTDPKEGEDRRSVWLDYCEITPKHVLRLFEGEKPAFGQAAREDYVVEVVAGGSTEYSDEGTQGQCRVGWYFVFPKSRFLEYFEIQPSSLEKAVAHFFEHGQQYRHRFLVRATGDLDIPVKKESANLESPQFFEERCRIVGGSRLQVVGRPPKMGAFLVKVVEVSDKARLVVDRTVKTPLCLEGDMGLVSKALLDQWKIYDELRRKADSISISKDVLVNKVDQIRKIKKNMSFGQDSIAFKPAWMWQVPEEKFCQVVDGMEVIPLDHKKNILYVVPNQKRKETNLCQGKVIRLKTF